MVHDKVLATAEATLMTRYGAGAKAIPWAIILEALLNILSGCLGTTADIRKEAKSPGLFMRIKMRRELRSMGVAKIDLDRAMSAAFTAAAEASDDDLEAFHAAAMDCCR